MLFSKNTGRLSLQHKLVSIFKLVHKSALISLASIADYVVIMEHNTLVSAQSPTLRKVIPRGSHKKGTFLKKGG